jgi:hypothetical protein
MFVESAGKGALAPFLSWRRQTGADLERGTFATVATPAEADTNARADISENAKCAFCSLKTK